MRTYRTCCVALSPAAERGPTAEKLCRYCAEILCFCPFHTLRRQILCRQFALTLIFFQGGLSQPFVKCLRNCGCLPGWTTSLVERGRSSLSRGGCGGPCWQPGPVAAAGRGSSQLGIFKSHLKH